MKLLTNVLIATALATGSSLAMAQPDQDHHGHHDDHGRYDHGHGHYDHGRYDHHVVVRHGPPHYGPRYHHWERGHRYGGPIYVVHDYRSYRLRSPPRGYHWVRADDGQYLLVAIATGIILDVALH